MSDVRADLLVWYCGRCRLAYRTEPRLAERACKCAAPIAQSFGPTKVYGIDLKGRLATMRHLAPARPEGVVSFWDFLSQHPVTAILLATIIGLTVIETAGNLRRR